jgi:Flp pilus assembly protein TadD
MEPMMRLTSALIVLGSAVIALSVPSPSHAAWCASYTIGATNCGFSSFQSCQAAVSGVGGTCTQSLEKTERSESAPKPQRRERSESSKRQKAAKRSERTKETGSAKPTAVNPGAPASSPAVATTSPQSRPQQDTGFIHARQLVLKGQYDAGIAALRALQFDDHPDVAAFLGLANRRLGRLEDARAWYERALRADPNNKLAISFYGMLRAETGEVIKAREDLDRLRQICGEAGCNEYQALAGVIAASGK